MAALNIVGGLLFLALGTIALLRRDLYERWVLSRQARWTVIGSGTANWVIAWAGGIGFGAIAIARGLA